MVKGKHGIEATDFEGRYVSVFGGQFRSQYDEGKSLIGCYMQDVLPEEKWRLFLSVVRRAIDSGTLQTCEYQLASSEVSVTDNDGPAGNAMVSWAGVSCLCAQSWAVSA